MYTLARAPGCAKGLGTNPRAIVPMMLEKETTTELRRVALFIDVDNVLIGAQESGLPFNLTLIIDRARQEGAIMSARAYADWTSDLLRPVLGDFRVNAIELIQLSTSLASSEHKNTADIQLAVDAVEMVFSPVRPDSIVIVGGDRDYVPLVQKLKRYGVLVTGIGVEAGVSTVLKDACDAFEYYDVLVPPAPEEVAGPLPSADPVEAYQLMRRAIEAINRGERRATGAAVHEMMKQLDPAFNLARYKVTMKQLAEAGEQEGYIRVSEIPGSDLVLESTTSVIESTEGQRREYDFSTTAAISAANYRTILQENRIPLLPWSKRQEFIEVIWRGFESRDSIGLSLDAMRGLILGPSDSVDRLLQQRVQKLLYTLNFARCFTLSKEQKGYPIAIPEQLSERLYPAVPAEEAVRRVHRQYLEVLARNDATLLPEAVFDLLYENEVQDEDKRQGRLEELTQMCDDIKPLNPFGNALRGMHRSR